MQVLFHFLGQQAANSVLLAAQCLVTALIAAEPSQMCPEFWEPQDNTVLANSIQWLCWICASAPPRVPGAQEGISPLDALTKILVTDKSTRFAALVWNWSLLESQGGQQGPDAGGALVELKTFFHLKKSSSYLPFS